MQDHLDYIDKIKGTAMLFVIICHIYIFTFGNSSFDGFRFVMSMELQVFMFVSGFLQYKQYSVESKVIKGAGHSQSCFFIKLKKLLVPFFIFGLLYTIYSTQIRFGGGQF